MPPPNIAPDCRDLYTKSQALSLKFYDVAGVFRLFSKHDPQKMMEWAEFRELVSSLPLKYEQAAQEIWRSQGVMAKGFRWFGTATSSAVSSFGFSHVTTHTTDRAGQIAAITGLLPLFRERTAASSLLNHELTKKEDSLRIYTLLGALFYRFFRIRNDYGTLEVATKQSALCFAIYRLLGLSSENQLDDWTVMTCCQYFYDFLKQGDACSEQPVAQVPYLAEDLQFFEKLTGIITQAKGKAQPVIQQLAYIQFIQSVAKTLEDIESKFLPLLENIVTSRIELMPNSSKSILIYLKKEKGVLPYHLAYLDRVIFDDETNFSQASSDSNALQVVVESIERRMAVRNTYILLGAYLSVLRVSEDDRFNQLLTSVIQTPQTGLLDFEARDLGLTLLEDFMGLPKIAETVELPASGIEPFSFAAHTAPVDIQCWKHLPLLKRTIEKAILDNGPLLIQERAEREVKTERRESFSLSA